ncbi:CRISPR-associated RAMP protein, Cmr6 family [Lachnospiraceae bacterium TWA4]|nr:CRISPR-associated RAMP protein, Cmr6 family [Lachnospiraceae bacterium TWA4]
MAISGYELEGFTLKVEQPGLLIGTGLVHQCGGKGEAALGISLDYVTGIPYIPSSSIKGMLRSAFQYPDYIAECINVEETIVKKLETSIFGDKKNQYPGTDIFFDAVVQSGYTGNLLARDNITPHRQKKELLELAEPNPITFLK